MRIICKCNNGIDRLLERTGKKLKNDLPLPLATERSSSTPRIKNNSLSVALRRTVPPSPADNGNRPRWLRAQDSRLQFREGAMGSFTPPKRFYDPLDLEMLEWVLDSA
jgi:hypothetical protein